MKLYLTWETGSLRAMVASRYPGGQFFPHLRARPKMTQCGSNATAISQRSDTRWVRNPCCGGSSSLWWPFLTASHYGDRDRQISLASASHHVESQPLWLIFLFCILKVQLFTLKIKTNWFLLFTFLTDVTKTSHRGRLREGGLISAHRLEDAIWYRERGVASSAAQSWQCQEGDTCCWFSFSPSSLIPDLPRYD